MTRIFSQDDTMSELEDDTETLYYLESYESSGSTKDPSEYDNVVEMYGSTRTSCGYCDRPERGRRSFGKKHSIDLHLTCDAYSSVA